MYVLIGVLVLWLLWRKIDAEKKANTRMRLRGLEKTMQKINVKALSMFCMAGVVFLCPSAMAHSGGVDKFGCHTSKADGYHCHSQKVERIALNVYGETQFQRSKRIAAQCRSLPKTGVCFGY